ncbi:hypothetical protein FQU76_25680 [Streptomyces qinzhouensis]|uniref:Uncharacterized protein n=1 Tax=Streptomyces qinzhouensis TaxID=2599401 RepID=A0A5B8JN08_9ACTN|nr:hypothetical protein FQU76_25680 [Streptomyces qinzhouensis]
MAGLLGGVLWWWAVLRLALVPERTGLLEGVLAAGGWGLGLLPVHATAYAGPRRGASAMPPGDGAPGPR